MDPIGVTEISDIKNKILERKKFLYEDLISNEITIKQICVLKLFGFYLVCVYEKLFLLYLMHKFD